MYIYVPPETSAGRLRGTCTADRALIPTLAFLPGDGRGFYYFSFCFCFPFKNTKNKKFENPHLHC